MSNLIRNRGASALGVLAAVGLSAAAALGSVIDTRDLAGNVDYAGLGPVGTCGGQDLWAQSVVADGKLLEEVRVRATHASNGTLQFDLLVTGARGDGGGGQNLAPNFADIRYTSALHTIASGAGTVEVTAKPNIMVAPGETLFIVIDTWTYRATSGCATVRGTNVSRYDNGEMVQIAAVGGEANLQAFDGRAWTHAGAGQDLAVLASFHHVVGQGAGDQFGWTADALGDVTGDGVGDFIVGAPRYNDKGRAYVYNGATLKVVHTLTGNSRGDRYGWAVAGVGDVDDDGTPDFAVGAPYRRDQRGQVSVYSGADASKIWSLNGAFKGDRLGWAIDGGVDINGDRDPDLIVGAPKNDETGSNAGKAYGFRGRDGRVVAVIRGERRGDLMGSAVALLDRVDSRREGGIVVGAPKNDDARSNAGKVYVFSSGAGRLLYTIRGRRSGDRFGSSITAIGRVDDDNKTDFAVCAPRYDKSRASDAGRVDVYSGRDGDRLWNRKGQGAGDRYGTTLAAAGDVNDDGTPDLMVGAPRHDGTGSNAGRAYVLSGANGAAIMVRDGARAGDAFGQALAGPGDLDGDGTDDPFVGAPKNDVAGSNAGRGHIGRSDAGLLPAGWIEPTLADSADDDDADDDADGRAHRAHAEDADVDADGDVDVEDLLALLAAWGGDDPRADLDGDGDVNADDVLEWLAGRE